MFKNQYVAPRLLVLFAMTAPLKTTTAMTTMLFKKGSKNTNQSRLDDNHNILRLAQGVGNHVLQMAHQDNTKKDDIKKPGLRFLTTEAARYTFDTLVCPAFNSGGFLESAPSGSHCSCRSSPHYTITCTVPTSCRDAMDHSSVDSNDDCAGQQVCVSQSVQVDFTHRGNQLVLTQIVLDKDFQGTTDYDSERIVVEQ